MKKESEEVTCEICGRPNIAKAEKCWYCQTPLIDLGNAEQTPLIPEEEMINNYGEEASFVKSSFEDQESENKKDTPEWLKKIRELINNEHQDEEPEDIWEQTGLFNSSDVSSRDKVNKHKENPDNKANEVKEKTIKINNGDNNMNKKEDLPDGFDNLSSNVDDK